jgi:DNA-binding MarR family transcriptional regulator
MKQKNDFPVSPPPRRELSDTPVKLCNEISRLFRFRIRQTEGQEGVMSQQGAHLVLSVLAIHDGIHQREVVRLTHLRPPTVSVILQKMEAEGLVECRSDPKDQRARLVYLSEAGRLRDREHIAQIRALDAVALNGLSAEEIDTLMRILPRIRDNLLNENEEEKGEMEKK